MHLFHKANLEGMKAKLQRSEKVLNELLKKIGTYLNNVRNK